MTYLDFYKLREDPFATVYDRSRYFPTAACAQAFKSLADGIAQRRGVMLLTGRIGVGKTFAINQFCSQLPPEWVSFHMLNSPQSGQHLLQQLASYLGLPHGSDRLSDLSTRLHRQIVRINERGRRAVLILDESESLSPEVLGYVRWLAEMEAFECKLVQIILVTRPGFRNKFMQPIWEPIRRRIALSCELNPMSPREVAGYIDHLIRRATDLGCVVEFAAEAKADIAQASGGLPRMVNAISRDCLLQGFQAQVQYIERDIVAQVLGGGGSAAEMDSAPAPIVTPEVFVPAPPIVAPQPEEPFVETQTPTPEAPQPPRIPQFDPADSLATDDSPMLLCAARFDEFKEVELAFHPPPAPVEVKIQTPQQAEHPTEPPQTFETVPETAPVETAEPTPTIESLLSTEPPDAAPVAELPEAQSPEAATLTEATDEFLNDPSPAAPQFDETFLQPDGQPWPDEPPSAQMTEESPTEKSAEQTTQELVKPVEQSFASNENVGAPPEEEELPPASLEPVQEEVPQQAPQTASAPADEQAALVQPPAIPERVEPGKRDRFSRPREVHLPSEEYRALRTSLLAACQGRFCFMVTSARPKEGKTATCMNLGIMMTERQNTRTVMVDANLRNHSLTNLMSGHSSPGLAEFLRGQATIEEILQPTDYDSLFLIGAGNLQDVEIGELLNRPELEGLFAALKRDFDHVIVDAPSVHRTTDATVIGEAAGNALMVVRMYDTSRDAVQMAIRQLKVNKVGVSGVILTNRKFFIPSALYRHI